MKIIRKGWSRVLESNAMSSGKNTRFTELVFNLHKRFRTSCF